MTPYQRDLGRAQRQLVRAVGRIRTHGFVKGPGPTDYHHIGFDMGGAIWPKANHPSPAIAHLAAWYAAEAVAPVMARGLVGMAYSPWRAMEHFCDMEWVNSEVVIGRLHDAIRNIGLEIEAVGA